MKFQFPSIITKPTPEIVVKTSAFPAYLSAFPIISFLQCYCKNTRLPELLFPKKCQENLTKFPHWVENIDNSSPLKKMGKIGKLGRGLALAGALTAASEAPALAQDKPNPDLHLASATTSEQVTNCVAFVKEQRNLAKETGISMSRRDQKKLLLQCENGKLDERIAEQEKILAALRKRLAELDIILDEQNQILDEQGQALLKIVYFNNQWIIQRKQLDNKSRDLDGKITASRARQKQIIGEFKRIMKELATS